MDERENGTSVIGKVFGVAVAMAIIAALFPIFLLFGEDEENEVEEGWYERNYAGSFAEDSSAPWYGDDYEYDYESDRGCVTGREMADGFYSETMKQAVRLMFGKPANEVTEEELAEIRYLDMEVSWIDEICYVSYSREDYRDYPVSYTEPLPDYYEKITFGYGKDFGDTIYTIEVPFPDESYSGTYWDLTNFQNVNCLSLSTCYYIDLEAFRELTMLECGDDVEEILAAGVDTEQLEVLKLDGGELSGIEQFTALEDLYINYIDIEQLERLENLETLETLYCVDLKNDLSYEKVKGLDGLKTLYVDGSYDGAKDLSAVAELKELENLSIADTSIITVEYLKELENLKTLRFAENEELDDFEGLEELESLEHLELNLYALNGYAPNCDEVGCLQNLKSLRLHTVYELDFLYELEQLEELDVTLTFYDDLIDPIQNMSNLKSLNLSKCHTYLPDGFVGLTKLTNLKKLTIDNMSFGEYDSIDGLFEVEGLEEFRVRKCEFYYTPERIVARDDLKVLDLSYTMFEAAVMEDGNIHYDEEYAKQSVLQEYTTAESLEELYLDYYCSSADLVNLGSWKQLKVLSLRQCALKKLPAAYVEDCVLLEEVYLNWNNISDISFVEKLPHLRVLDLEDCYVSDIMPLESCPELEWVNLRDNPVSEE